MEHETENLDFNFDIDAILDSVGDELAVTEVEEQQAAGGIPYISFAQNMSKYPSITPKPLGFATIAINATDEKWNGILLDNPIFWMLDNLNEWLSVSSKGTHYYRYGQTMFAYDENTGLKLADGKPPVCKSVNGLQPLERHIGQVFKFPRSHPKAGQQVMIGYELVERDAVVNLEPVAVNEICPKCPLRQWTSMNVIENGQTVKKNFAPICQETAQIVVWFPPQIAQRPTGDRNKPYENIDWQGGLAILQGSPASVQNAIEGTKGSSSGGALGDKDLPEFFGFTRSTGNEEVLVEKKILNDKRLPLVTGFQKTASSKRLDANEENLADDSIKYAWMKVPVYPYAPKGLPELVGKQALDDMRYLTFSIVQNKRTGNPYVPMFGLSTQTVNPNHYGAFLLAKKQYNDDKVRDRLLGVTNQTQVAQRLLAAPMAANAPRLSAGTGSTTSVEDLSDM